MQRSFQPYLDVSLGMGSIDKAARILNTDELIKDKVLQLLPTLRQEPWLFGAPKELLSRSERSAVSPSLSGGCSPSSTHDSFDQATFVFSRYFSGWIDGWVVWTMCNTEAPLAAQLHSEKHLSTKMLVLVSSIGPRLAASGHRGRADHAPERSVYVAGSS